MLLGLATTRALVFRRLPERDEEMKTIAEWQKAAYECARSKGFHDCRECDGGRHNPQLGREDANCDRCNGTGLAPMTPTRIGARLAGIHAAISRAYECLRRGRTDLIWVAPDETHRYLDRLLVSDYVRQQTKAAGYKPEGFGIELADVFLRLCDLAESLAHPLREPETQEASDEFKGSPDQIAATLNDLHGVLGSAYPLEMACAAGTDVLQDTLDLLASVAKACNVDLLAMAELKYQYNLTRPER